MGMAAFNRARKVKQEKTGFDTQEKQFDFDSMTRAQIEEYAAQNGIDLSGAKNNHERREILQAGGV